MCSNKVHMAGVTKGCLLEDRDAQYPDAWQLWTLVQRETKCVPSLHELENEGFSCWSQRLDVAFSSLQVT